MKTNSISPSIYKCKNFQKVNKYLLEAQQFIILKTKDLRV